MVSSRSPSPGLQAVAGGWISYWSDHSKAENPHYISSEVGLIGYSTLSLAAARRMARRIMDRIHGQSDCFHL